MSFRLFCPLPHVIWCSGCEVIAFLLPGGGILIPKVRYQYRLYGSDCVIPLGFFHADPEIPEIPIRTLDISVP